MDLIAENDTTRTWLYTGAEARAVYDALCEMNSAIQSIGTEAEEAAKPIREAEELAMSELLARHAEEIASLRRDYRDKVDESHRGFRSRAVAESVKFHSWLWDGNPVMTRDMERRPQIPTNQFEAGSQNIMILEYK